jgi:hypothetical protein
MLRDPNLALLAVNRFGFGPRGGAATDLANAAADPRGFVKADLKMPGVFCLRCLDCKAPRL